MSAEVIKMEYASSLADLTMNSKPLIIVLTMLAEENLPNAKIIVEAIEEHLAKASIDVKLPILYLIDCIVKNVGQTYKNLFSLNLVTTFSNVFKLVDEKTRAEMFKLRQTWNDVFPQMKLYAIDVRINTIDPAWPVTAHPNSIHLNPKFLKNQPGNQSQPSPTSATPIIDATPPNASLDKETLLMQEQLIQKKKELLELQKKTLELEVLQTQVKLQEQMKSNTSQMNILLKPEVAKQLMPETASSTKSKQANMPDFLMNNQRLPASNQNKINPVNPALVAAAAAAASKPIRDPRLLRQQQQDKHHQKGNSENHTVVSSSTTAASLPAVASMVPIEKVAVYENNKNVTNKLSVRDAHKDTRLSNKIEKKSKVSSKSSVSYTDFSKNLNHATNNSNSHKTDTKSASASKVSSHLADKSANNKSSSFSNESSSSNTSLDSPNSKNKSRSSSSKHRKRDRIEHDNDHDTSRPNKRGKISNKGDPNNTYKNTNNDNSSTFKNGKNSNKNRTYTRHHLNGSPTEDAGAYVRNVKTHEKLPTRTQQQNDKTNNESPVATAKPMDVDLRQLSMPISKRRSTETPDHQSKKQRSLDTLFGNEDIDLRQLNVPKAEANNERQPFVPSLERPPTPPPPIISISSEEQHEEPVVTAPIVSPKSDLDTVRAKLAHASGWAKVASKSYNKRKLQNETALNDFYIRHQTPASAPSQTSINITPVPEPIEGAAIKTSHTSKPLDNHIPKRTLLETDTDKNQLGTEKPTENESVDFTKDVIETTGPTGAVYQDTDERIHIPHHVSPVTVVQKPQLSPPTVAPLPPAANRENTIPPPPIPPSHLHSSQFFPMANDVWPAQYNMTPQLNNRMELPFMGNSNSVPLAARQPIPTTVAPASAPISVPSSIDVQELYKKLVQSGFVNPNRPPSPRAGADHGFGGQMMFNDNFPSNSNSQSDIWGTPSLSPPLSSMENNIHYPNNSGIEATIITMKNNKKAFVSAMKPISFAKPETLRTLQPFLYTTLYSGMQCSSCGMRFSPEASMFYSQHLDWHFRQNRKGKMNAKVASSRKWYYSLADWKNYEEIEDLEEREKNYFDQQQQTETVEEVEEAEIPSVPADPNSTDERCQVCRDTFEQFFNEDKEEWHLKNAIKMDDKTYHPVCYEDYQNSTKDASLSDSKLDSITLSPKNTIIPGLEIILDDDDDDDDEAKMDEDTGKGSEVISLADENQDKTRSNNDENKEKEADQLNENNDTKIDDDDGDDDDVILNEVAPIKIIVDDDDDDEEDDGAAKEPLFSNVIKRKLKEEFDDGFVDVDESGLVNLSKVGEIKIKTEPIEEDDELLTNDDAIKILEDSAIGSQSQPLSDIPVTTHTHMVTSIDGNVELVSSNPLLTPTPLTSGKIKINISKPLPVITSKEIPSTSNNNINTNKLGNSEEQIVDPEIHHCKPALKDVPLRKMPRVVKGHELSGLCSIM